MKINFNVLEEKIHADIAKYLNIVIKRPSRWHTVEVSNQAFGKQAMIRQMRLKRRGVITGWPDITIMWRTLLGWKLIFLEIKALNGKLTEKQECLHNELIEDGHYVYVVRSVDDVEKILKELKVI